LTRFLSAIADRDADAVAECFTDDALYAFAVPHPPIAGREAIRTMFAGLLDAADEARWDVVTSVTDGDRVGSNAWTGSGSMAGKYRSNASASSSWPAIASARSATTSICRAGARGESRREHRRQLPERTAVDDGGRSAMTRHLLLVSANAADGQEAEFHQWYDEEHLPEILKVPGFVRAQRFIAAPSTGGQLPSHSYLAVYEIETEDLPGALAALSTAAAGMHISAAFDRTGSSVFAYTAFGPAQEAK
jgi:hypothetical protein